MTNQPTKRGARALADISAGIILASVEIAAPITRVFEALTKPEEIVRWWGSDELYRTTEWVGELRAGGRWHASGRAQDGSPFSVEGEYLEVDPPHTIVHTWKAAWDAGAVTTVTIRLEEIPGGTRVNLRHDGFKDRPEACHGHTQGWERVLGWLGAYSGSAPASGAYFLLRLNGPRPSFPSDATPEELAVMQEHVRYCKRLIAEGKALVFGPVLDPRGTWGLGVVRVGDLSEAQAIVDQDPATLSGRGFRYEVHPLASAIAPV